MKTLINFENKNIKKFVEPKINKSINKHFNTITQLTQ